MALPPDPNPSPSAPARSSLPFILSAVMLAVYCGFVLLVAYNKPLLGSQIMPGLCWGILLGALVIVIAWVLTYIYVLASNNRPAGK